MGIPGLTTATDVLLELDLTRGLQEGPPSTPLQALRSRGVPVLRDVVEGLHRAAEDDHVVGLIAHMGAETLSLAQAGEIRDAVRAFAASGKPTVAWAEAFGELGPGNISYYAATGFEEIWLQPIGDLGLVGMTAQAVFIKGALDKLHVQTQFGQRHEYKTAANTFTQEGMTEAHREMATRLAESATETIVSAVADARGIDVEAVRAIIDEAPLHAPRALELGLVDHLGYRAQVYASLRERVGQDADLRYVERYGKGPMGAASSVLDKIRAKGQPNVAVVHAAGPITLGRNSSSPFSSASIGSESLGAALRAAGRDDDIKAVVLRVDSPGGSYVGSDAIRHEIKALRASGTPVVATMGTVAGSGGYYITMCADRLLAQPGTITGSIGVLAGKQVLADALGRVGVNVEHVATGRFADMLSSQRPFTDEEWALLNDWLDRAYDDFTAKAAEDRGMDVERLRELAKGRVWTGADALEHGLVDQLGGLEDAIDLACELASIDRAHTNVTSLPQSGLLARLMPAENSDHPAAAASTQVPSGLAGLLAGLRPAGAGAGALAAVVDQVLGGELRTAGAAALTMPVTWQLR